MSIIILKFYLIMGNFKSKSYPMKIDERLEMIKFLQQAQKISEK